MMVSQIHNHELNKFSVNVRALQALHQTNNFIKLIFGVAGLCVVTIVASPLLTLAIIWATRTTRKVAIGLQKEVATFSKTIKSKGFSYRDAKEILDIYIGIRNNSEKLGYVQKNKMPKFLHPIIENMRISHISALQIIGMIEESYTFNSKESSFNEDELNFTSCSRIRMSAS